MDALAHAVLPVKGLQITGVIPQNGREEEQQECAAGQRDRQRPQRAQMIAAAQARQHKE